MTEENAITLTTININLPKEALDSNKSQAHRFKKLEESKAALIIVDKAAGAYTGNSSEYPASAAPALNICCNNSEQSIAKQVVNLVELPKTPPRAKRKLVSKTPNGSELIVKNDADMSIRNSNGSTSEKSVLLFSARQTDLKISTPRKKLFSGSHSTRTMNKTCTVPCGTTVNDESRKSGKKQKQVMTSPAKKAIQDMLAGFEQEDKYKNNSFEWLHLTLHHLSRDQGRENLIAGTSWANIDMLTLERVAVYFQKHLPQAFSVTLDTTATVIKDSDNVAVGDIKQNVSVSNLNGYKLTISRNIPADLGVDNEDSDKFSSNNDTVLLIAAACYEINKHFPNVVYITDQLQAAYSYHYCSAVNSNANYYSLINQSVWQQQALTQSMLWQHQYMLQQQPGNSSVEQQSPPKRRKYWQ